MRPKYKAHLPIAGYCRWCAGRANSEVHPKYTRPAFCLRDGEKNFIIEGNASLTGWVRPVDLT